MRHARGLRWWPALLLAFAAVVALAGCTGSVPAAGSSARGSAAVTGSGAARGSAGLLATPGGVVWAQAQGGAVLRSADRGRDWQVMPLPDTDPDHAEPVSAAGVITTFFLDSQHAWAVEEGDEGATSVYRTANGGRTWTPAPVPGAHIAPTPAFDQIGFSDATHGWLLAAASDFGNPTRLRLGAWRTSDGGATWARLPDTSWPLQGLALAAYGQTPCPSAAAPHLTMTATGTAWLSPGACEHGPAHPAVWRSSDGGVTWARSALPAPPGGWGHWEVLDRGGTAVGPVTVLGSGSSAVLLVPVAVGASSLVVERSDDAGRTWRVAGRVGDTQGAPEQIPSEYFDPIDAGHWVVAASGGLLETADAGRSWTLRRASLDGPRRPVSFTSLDDGYRAGTGLVAAERTLDAGRSWATLPVPVTGAARVGWAGNQRTMSVLAVLGKRSVLAGGALGLYRSADGGTSWTHLLGASTPVDQFDVVDATTAFAVTDDELLRTTDAGRHWSAIGQPDTGPVDGVQFASASTGLAVSFSNRLVRTTDSGRTWAPVALPAGWPFNAGALLDTQPRALCLAPGGGWLVASHDGRDEVFTSSDVGSTWHPVLGSSTFTPTAAAGEALRLEIAGCHATTGWVLAAETPTTEGGMAGGTISTPYELLRSTDQGRSWTAVLRSPGAAPTAHAETPPDGTSLGPTGSIRALMTAGDEAAWLTMADARPNPPHISTISTGDGGRSWTTTQAPSTLTQAGVWWTTAAADRDHAWALFRAPDQSGPATVYASDDAGHTWHRTTTFTWSH